MTLYAGRKNTLNNYPNEPVLGSVHYVHVSVFILV